MPDSRAVKEDLEHIDALEVAFSRLGPIVKARMLGNATSIHPELRPAGWHVLRVVLHGAKGVPEEPVTVGEIIAVTGMDKSVVSRQLRDLKEWGLVTVTRSEEDARMFVVTPTPLAKERKRAAAKQQREDYRRFLSSWEREDVERLTELLMRLADSAGPARTTGG